MSLREIAHAVARDLDEHPEHVLHLTRLTLWRIRDVIDSGEPFKIQGFGTFYPRMRRARLARNPRTGEPALVQPLQAMAFRQERACHKASTAQPTRSARQRTPGMRSELGRLCAQIGADHGRLAHDLLQMVTRVLHAIEQTTHQRGRCHLHGLGTFRTRKAAPRMARNPRTGEPAVVPAKVNLVFSPAPSKTSQSAQATAQATSHETAHATAQHTRRANPVLGRDDVQQGHSATG